MGLCFVRDAVAHYWMVEAPWNKKLDTAGEEFNEQRRFVEQERESSRNARTDEEAERLTAQLTASPQFRAATRYGAWLDVAQALLPDPEPEPDADDEEACRAHEDIIRNAVRHASEVVERESRRVYAA